MSSAVENAAELERDCLLVGHPQMDEDHEIFSNLIHALEQAEDASLLSCLEDVIEHAQAHFAQEDGWMQALQFPARQCHMDEHAAVMRTAVGVRQRLLIGDCDAVRRFAGELATWFPPHVQHLDSALSAWICKQAWNAKPLVFHRPQGAVHRATLAV